MRNIWGELKIRTKEQVTLRALTLAGLITLINNFKNKNDFSQLGLSNVIFDELNNEMLLAYEQGANKALTYIEKELGDVDSADITTAHIYGSDAIKRLLVFSQRQFQAYALRKANYHLKTKQNIMPSIKMTDSINRRWDMDVIITLRMMIELHRFTARIALSAARKQNKTLIYVHHGRSYAVESEKDIGIMVDNGILHPNSSATPRLVEK